MGQFTEPPEYQHLMNMLGYRPPEYYTWKEEYLSYAHLPRSFREWWENEYYRLPVSEYLVPLALWRPQDMWSILVVSERKKYFRTRPSARIPPRRAWLDGPALAPMLQQHEIDENLHQRSAFLPIHQREHEDVGRQGHFLPIAPAADDFETMAPGKRKQRIVDIRRNLENFWEPDWEPSIRRIETTDANVGWYGFGQSM